jgi:uncharacterized membrane protein
MTWARRYVLKSYLRSSLWVVPVTASLAEMVTVRVMKAIDDFYDWIPASPFSLASAQMVLQAISTVALTFLAFTFASMLVALQVASAQLTPRIIATTLLRDNVIRFSAGLFIYTMLFAVGAQARMGQEVDHLVLLAAVGFGWCSILAFLYLVDYASRLLRPVTVVWRIGKAGLTVIESVYLLPTKAERTAVPFVAPSGDPMQTVLHRGTSGIVLAVNIDRLIEQAKRTQCIIELVPQVGDFVAVGEPLLLVHGGLEPVNEGTLAGTVAFGRERTIEQDPTFAFRVIVDIACKALSKAINDPTTAVLAVDQLHRLLRTAGKRDLRSNLVRDAAGEPRVIMRTPNWENFVHLACREIRLYGAENPQIARRLRAMLQNLVHTLPAHRHPALLEELALLDRMIEKSYLLREDAELARVADSQGLGGASAR